MAEYAALLPFDNAEHDTDTFLPRFDALGKDLLDRRAVWKM
jgi:hypothetical protein